AHAIDDAWRAHLDEGLDHTGVMVHLVPDERVDEGPVLATRVVPIHPDDTRDALEERIHAVEHELLVGVLADLVDRHRGDAPPGAGSPSAPRVDT
ncbi:MAG: hypothetical protein D6683_11210, partial [Actinomyces sp.]